MERIEKIENEVTSRHNMNRFDYKASTEARAEKVPALKEIMEYMIQTLIHAGKGHLILPLANIPPELSPLKVFELLVNSERIHNLKVA